MNDSNPYASPKAQLSSETSDTDNSKYERLRNEHLKHEASIKSIGSLYFLGAIFCLLGGIGFLFTGGISDSPEAIIFFLIFIILGALQVWLAMGLRKLSPVARVPTGILAGIGLIGFPIGTLINGYILYLLFSEKGGVVFSERYKLAIEATPHIKYKSSIIIKVFLGLLLCMLGFAALALFAR